MTSSGGIVFERRERHKTPNFLGPTEVGDIDLILYQNGKAQLTERLMGKMGGKIQVGILRSTARKRKRGGGDLIESSV